MKKVFVDGKEFFGEDVTSAIKSLPAQAVDKVEVYVHGFEGDLYDRHLEIFLYRKVRDERRFDGVEALIEQIRRDVAELEEWWGAR